MSDTKVVPLQVPKGRLLAGPSRTETAFWDTEADGSFSADFLKANFLPAS